MLGTVPVEADGSAYFEAPAGKAIYFQALDEQGMAVQSMRSATYVHPGEQLTCQGCHERKHDPPNRSPQLPLACGARRRRSGPTSRAPIPSTMCGWCSRCWIAIASAATRRRRRWT